MQGVVDFAPCASAYGTPLDRVWVESVNRSRRWSKPACFVALVLLANAALYFSAQADSAFIRDIAFKIAPPGTPDVEVVRAVSRYVRDEIYHPTREEVEHFPFWVRLNYLYNPFRIGPRPILEYGTHHLGPCQSNSRAFMALLAAHGISSRMVVQHDANLLGLHSVIEVDYAGTHGIVGPTNGVIYQHEDGRPATLKELHKDRDLFVRNAVTGFAYGWGPNGKEYTVPLPYDLYNFDYAYYFNYKWLGALRWPAYKALVAIWGENGPYLPVRPLWYTYPKYTCMVVLDAGVIGAGFILWAGRRLRRRFAKATIPVKPADKPILPRERRSQHEELMHV